MLVIEIAPIETPSLTYAEPCYAREFEWLLLDATTTADAQGTGVAETALSDISGRCGTAIQTLLIAPR